MKKYFVLTRVYPQGGRKAFNGLNSNYNTQYPSELTPYIPREDYYKAINQVNETL